MRIEFVYNGTMLSGDLYEIKQGRAIVKIDGYECSDSIAVHSMIILSLTKE